MARTLALALILALPAPALAEGSSATNFTVRDLAGKHLRLSDFSKQVVLMSFWATWCKPCLVELKHLEKLYRKYRSRGFVVLAINMDGAETQGSVRPFVRRYQISFPVVIDRETTVVKLYNPKRAAPYSVLIRRGTVVKTREGFQVSDLPAIEKEIAEQLR